eukprot:m.51137 g.51137  ORF g.51137 m.51137 type:complete len:224 (+) comp34117_c0_seq3:464-1135(+)
MAWKWRTGYCRVTSRIPLSMGTSNSTMGVLCFGDSLTNGYHRGGFAFHPYSKHLQELLSVDHPNLKIVTEGVSGEKASDMNTRLAVLLRERQYDWVIILGGTNDLAYDAKPKALAETIFLLHSMCHKVGARTVAITIPECAIERKESGESLGEAKNAVNNLIRDFALKSDGKVLLADLWAEIPCVSLSKEEQEKYWDDHLHFSPAGYDKMADIIYKVFKNSTV